MSRSDIRKVLKEAIARGWKDVSHLRRRNCHFMIEHPSGVRITAAMSPSDGRAHKNLRADIRRAERMVAEGQKKHYTDDK